MIPKEVVYIFRSKRVVYETTLKILLSYMENSK